jgi:hypothetical protein
MGIQELDSAAHPEPTAQSKPEKRARIEGFVDALHEFVEPDPFPGSIVSDPCVFLLFQQSSMSSNYFKPPQDSAEESAQVSPSEPGNPATGLCLA